MRGSNKKNQINMIKSIRYNLKYERYDLAKELIDEYIYLYGDDCYIELEKARYYHFIKNLKEAKKLLNNLIYTNSKNIGYVLYELAKVYEESGKFDKAIEIYKEIDNTNHKNKNYSYFQIGILYEKKSNFNEAISYFEKVILSNDELKDEALFHLARIYFYTKQFEKSKNYFNKIVSHHNRMSRLIAYYQIKIELSLGNKKRYKELINEYLLRFPDSNELLTDKVKILISENKIQEAKIYLNKIKKDKTLDDSSYDLIYAEYYEKANEFDRALELYYKLISKSSDIKRHIDIDRVMVGIGTCYIGLGKTDEGYNWFKKIYDKQDSYTAIALYNLVSIDIHKGNYDKAYELFTSVNMEKISKSDIANYVDLKLMLEKLLNIHTVYQDGYSYRQKQIINYDEKLALKHIQNGHSYDEFKKNESIFSKDIDIEKLFNEVKDKLNDDSLVRINVFDKYKIYYENIGSFNNRALNYLAVITIPYSNEIITMYPTNETLEENIEITSDELLEKPMEKIYKRESQIEKFNRRYNIKSV